MRKYALYKKDIQEWDQFRQILTSTHEKYKTVLSDDLRTKIQKVLGEDRRTIIMPEGKWRTICRGLNKRNQRYTKTRSSEKKREGNICVNPEDEVEESIVYNDLNSLHKSNYKPLAFVRQNS